MQLRAGCLLGLAVLIVVPLAAGQTLAQGTPGGANPCMPAGRNTASLHPFWDRKNILLFSGVALFRGLDYTSTKNMLARGREEILIPDEVVNSRAGFPALEAAGAATSIGLSYVMHRTKHHKLERWVSIIHIGVTGFGSARNYALKSKH